MNSIQLSSTHTQDRPLALASMTIFQQQGSQSFTDKKRQDFPGPPWIIFQHLFRACKYSNIKRNGIYLQYSECSPLQQIQHKANVDVSCSETECYTIAACFPLEPLEKCMTFKDIFWRLPRTKVILSRRYHCFFKDGFNILNYCSLK